MTLTPDRQKSSLPADTELPAPPVVVDVHGDLDSSSVPQVVEQLEDALSAGPAELVVDLGDCPSVDATGLAALVDTHRQQRRAGGVLTLAHCSPRVLRLLSLTGLRRVFDLRA
jgi:anti-anti-sigma factor